MDEHKRYRFAAKKLRVVALTPAVRVQITALLTPGEFIISVVRSTPPRRSFVPIVRVVALVVLLAAVAAAASASIIDRSRVGRWVITGTAVVAALWTVNRSFEKRHIVVTDQRLITMVTSSFGRVRVRSRDHSDIAFVDVVQRLVVPGTVIARRSTGRRAFTLRFLEDPLSVASALQCLVGRLPAAERSAPLVFISFHSPPELPADLVVTRTWTFGVHGAH